jgi:hypothetical protein
MSARRLWLDGLKAKPCQDCGGTFPPECMDFDHKPGFEKRRKVAGLFTCSKAKVLSEIEKCDLVCANCHRTRTVRRNRETK